MGSKTSWVKIYDFKQHGLEPQLLNSVRSVEVEDKRICLVYNSTGYYALDDKCPHAGARFGAGGWCENNQLVCPIHRHKFNLTNGRGSQGDNVNTYPVEHREDGVYVGLVKKKKWWVF